MRKFGSIEQNYFQFQIEGSEKVYKIPTAASLPVSVLLQIKEADAKGNGFEAQVEMLRKYMGDIVDEFPAGTVSDILEAWGNESVKAGASPGESSALPE